MKVACVTKGNAKLGWNNNVTVTSFINLDKLPELAPKRVVFTFKLLPLLFLVIFPILCSAECLDVPTHTIYTLARARTTLRTL